MKGEGMALEGLKVLDLGQVIAGNFCSVVLADFGAEVIKIEKPGAGDSLRSMGNRKDGISTGHMVDSRNKKCITLDLKTDKGKEIFFKLLKDADVVVENYAVGVLEKMGLGYDVLEKVNPRVIFTRISGFGQTGPKKNSPGYDRVGMAYGGITFVTGHPDGPPTRPGIAVSDYTTGMWAAIGTLIALYNRDVVGTGKGQVVDVSLFESIFRIMEATATDYKFFGNIRQRIGNAHPMSVPGDHYLTKDCKWVTIASTGDKVFNKYAKAIGREDLLEDDRYNKQIARQEPENKAVIEQITKEWVAAHTESECTEILDGVVPYGPILDIEGIFQQEHYYAREDIIEVMQDKVGKVTMQGVVPKLSKTPGEVKWAGGSLGAYNDEIYKGLLGMTDEEILKLKEENII